MAVKLPAKARGPMMVCSNVLGVVASNNFNLYTTRYSEFDKGINVSDCKTKQI